MMRTLSQVEQETTSSQNLANAIGNLRTTLAKELVRQHTPWEDLRSTRRRS